ncbi:MAG TPA: gamma-glutamyltransferase [Thermoanaerobaculia bacterium]|nr:gamma-glutamyltransferase [Thermoanaerobaculia bacterium]
MTRRALLAGGALAGAAAPLLPAQRGSTATALAMPRGPVTASAQAVPTDEERRRLIDAASFGRKSAVRSKGGLAICTHPLAANEAVQMLRAGGNACDGALAAAIAQTVVEPHMTTITGCLCLLYWDAAQQRAFYCNGNVDAPLAPLPGFGAGDLDGGRGVAVPGWWAGFEEAHRRFGALSRSQVMAGAIRYARDGFEIHPFLWGEMFAQAHRVGLTDHGREIFFAHGALLDPGALLVQRRAADTLERLVDEGSDFFYRGAFAEELVRVVSGAGGVLTRADLERYAVRWPGPARGTYRGHEVLASPPPDNGGTHLIEILNLVEQLDLQRLGPPTESAETLQLMASFVHEVYLEGARQRDPRSHPLPLETILSKDYARIRFELLQMGSTLPALPSAPPPPAGSNHVTVIDGQGNICTVLHSCMSLPWTNGLFAGGVSVCAAGAHFLRVMPKPGDRISAYVAPNIVLRDGRPILASGSPSASLLQTIVQNTVNLLDFGLSIQESVHRPRFGGPSFTGAVPGRLLVESDVPPRLRESAAKRGISWDVVSPWCWQLGSFDGIFIDPASGASRACGDPRRTAQALAV